jgi:hypothetical protein
MTRLTILLVLVLIASGCDSGVKIISRGEPPVAQDAANQAGIKAKSEKPKTEVIADTPIQNPFLSSEENAAKKTNKPQEAIDYLNLTTIFFSPPSSRATIEGKIVKEGDMIDNKKIVEIQREAIILQSLGNEYILRLKDINETKKTNSQDTATGLLTK